MVLNPYDPEKPKKGRTTEEQIADFLAATNTMFDGNQIRSFGGRKFKVAVDVTVTPLDTQEDHSQKPQEKQV